MDRITGRVGPVCRRAVIIVPALVATAVIVALSFAVSAPVAGAAVPDWGGLEAFLLGMGASGGPLKRLRQQINQLANGDYDIDLSTNRDDEIGELYDALQELVAGVRAREQALREQRERHAVERDRRATLFEQASDPMARVTIGESAGIQAVNSRFKRVFVPDGESAEGEPVDALFEGSDAGGSEQLLAGIRSGEAVRREIRRPTVHGTGTYVVRLELVEPRDDTTTAPDEGFVIFEEVPEEASQERSERIRQDLYEITSDPSLDSERKIQRLLERGCEWLDLDNGFLSIIDEDAGQYTVEQAVGDDFVDAGAQIPLSKTFCRRTIVADDLLSFRDAMEAGLDDDPGYTDSGIACYIGARITVDGELYGTFCFFDDEASETGFTHVDKAVMDLMGRWVSYELERQKRDEELRLEHRAMDAAPVGITIIDATDPDRPIVTGNERFAEMTGYDVDEIVGQSHSLLRGERTSEDALAALDQAITDHKSTTVDLRSYREDGEEFWAQVSLAPVTDSTGTVTNTVAFWEDVTERREAQRRLEAIVENTDNPIYFKNINGKYQLMNDAAATLFGYDPDEVVGKTDEDLFGPESAAEIRAVDERIVESGSAVTEETIRMIDGERHDFLDNKYPYRDEDGEIAGVMGISQDITQRKTWERRLEAEKERFETLLRNLPGMVYRCRNERGWPMSFVSEGCTALAGYDPARIENGEILWGEDIVIEGDREQVWADVQAAVKSEQPFTVTYRIETADGDLRWVWEQGRGVRDEDGNPVVLEGYIVDITERRQREMALESLHSTTRDLLTTDTESAVAQRVVETASDVLDSPAVALYRFDPDANALDPVASTEPFEDLAGTVATVSTEHSDSQLWNCFITGTPIMFEEGDTGADEWVPGVDVDGGLLVPVGDHGVFMIAAGEPTDSEDERRLAETLAATTEAAFARLEHEASLREREQELKTRNRELERRIRITDIIRGIDQSLITAESREEIESSVCEQLVAADDIAFAWIGGRDTTDGNLSVRAWAGDRHQYLDDVPLGEDSAEPAMRTVREGEPIAVHCVADRLRDEEWTKDALASNFESALSVPLAVDDRSHGVLAVYASEPEAFSALERTVFSELGTNVANSIEAVTTRRALHADTVAELSLRFDDADTFLAQFASKTGGRVEYEGLAAQSNGESTALLRVVNADTDAIDTHLADAVAVADYRCVSDAGDATVFEVTVSGQTLPTHLARAGATVNEVSATAAGVDAVVEVPRTTDVRVYVDRVREHYSTVELVGRQTVERATQTRAGAVSLLFERLTDRQREVLQTAYIAGFFERPRENTGEEVAAMLDISQPTFSRHLRHAQQRLFAELFDSVSAGSDTDETRGQQ